jgi:hypothetical protein
MELMSLLNLCRVKADWMPTEIVDFVGKYMDSSGKFTKDGLVNYMDSIAGQISYLNREADPSQFAQPIFAEIVVPISLIESVDESVDLGDLKKELAELSRGNLAFYHDPKMAIVYPLKARGFPTSILYDREGKELARLAGEADWNSSEARALIQAVIDQ